MMSTNFYLEMPATHNTSEHVDFVTQNVVLESAVGVQPDQQTAHSGGAEAILFGGAILGLLAFSVWFSDRRS